MSRPRPKVTKLGRKHNETYVQIFTWSIVLIEHHVCTLACGWISKGLLNNQTLWKLRFQRLWSKVLRAYIRDTFLSPTRRLVWGKELKYGAICKVTSLSSILMLVASVPVYWPGVCLSTILHPCVPCVLWVPCVLCAPCSHVFPFEKFVCPDDLFSPGGVTRWESC